LKEQEKQLEKIWRCVEKIKAILLENRVILKTNTWAVSSSCRWGNELDVEIGRERERERENATRSSCPTGLARAPAI
jgi:hypothetical protein